MEILILCLEVVAFLSSLVAATFAHTKKDYWAGLAWIVTTIACLLVSILQVVTKDWPFAAMYFLVAGVSFFFVLITRKRWQKEKQKQTVGESR